MREWLRAQAAGGYLDYDPATGTFTLPDAVAAAICDGPGGALVDAAATMFSSMGEGFAAFSEAFSTGQGFGWHQRTAAHWHGTDAFTRVALPAGLIAAAIGEMAGVAAVLAAGGSVADVGCGYGTPTMAIADLFPAARVLGVDYHDASIAHVAPRPPARRRHRAVRGRARGRPARAGLRPDHLLRLPARHRRPARRATRARAALAPAGAVLLVEPMGADDVEDNLNPVGRMFYAVSTLACTPNAVSQKTATSSEPLGLAGQQRLRAVAAGAGFGRVRRLDVPAPMNLVLELRP